MKEENLINPSKIFEILVQIHVKNALFTKTKHCYDIIINIMNYDIIRFMDIFHISVHQYLAFNFYIFILMYLILVYLVYVFSRVVQHIYLI